MTVDFNTSEQSEPALIRRRATSNDWFEKCTKKLRAISSLSEDWDSYGARKPSSLSLHYAYLFLDCLRDVVGVTEPIIAPSPNGNICFEWEDDVMQLMTEIDDTGMHHFYYCYRDDSEIEGETLDSAEIRQLVTKF